MTARDADATLACLAHAPIPPDGCVYREPLEVSRYCMCEGDGSSHESHLAILDPPDVSSAAEGRDATMKLALAERRYQTLVWLQPAAERPLKNMAYGRT